MLILDRRQIQPATPSWPLVETAQSTLVGLIAGMLGLAPLAAPVLLGVLTLLTITVEWQNGGSPIATFISGLRMPASLACLAFLGFAAISSVWSSEPMFGLVTVFRVSMTFFAALYLTLALRQQMSGMTAVHRTRFVRAIPMGALFAVLVLLVEFLTDNGLSGLIFKLAPGLWSGSPKLIVAKAGEAARLVPEPFMHNRGVAAMVVLAPVFMLGIAIWQKRSVNSWTIPLSALVLAVTVYLSESETAKLAMLGGVVSYALAVMRPVGAWRSLSAVCIIGTVLALPLAMVPYWLGVHTWSAASFSAQERATIWRNTAVSTLNRPLFGVGVQSTRFQESDLPKIETPSGKLRSPLGWHAHNAFLQTWFELGAAGALGLLVAILSLIGASRRLDQSIHPAAAALVTIVLCTAATGWSLWQPWLIATFAFGAVFIAMLDAAREKD